MSKSYNDCLSTRIRHGNATPKEEALADAAPDLLAACKEWAAFADTLERSTEPGDPIAEVRNRVHGARIAKTRAAIRKAEGGGE